MLCSGRIRKSFFWLCALLIAISCVGILGCAWGTWKPIKLDDLRGEGYAGEDAEWGQGYRSRDRSVLPAGLNGRAQDIEQSLGIDTK